LPRLDLWRNGYDAVVGWLGQGDMGQAGALEILAADWPGRALFVIERGEGSRVATARLAGAGGRVLPLSPGAGWDRAAQLVVQAVQGTPG